MLESTEVTTFLVTREKKYLGLTRNLLRSLTDASLQNAIGQVAPNAGQKLEKGFEVLTEWSDVLNKRESFIRFMLIELKKVLDRFIRFIRAKVEVFIANQKKKIKEKLEKIKANHELELQRIKERAINVDAKVMSIAMGLAARLFWTGATWQGNTGTNHITLTIGPFKPLKALPEDGVTGLVEELGKSFENQLVAMSGLVIPPANTGIVPIPFQGYK
jgi:hypothetical protein